MDAILGYMIAIALSMLSIGQFYQWQASGMTNVQTAAAASQQVIYNKAAAQYVQDNATTIASLSTSTVPVTITTAMLISAGYLPGGFSTTNVFGQTWQLQVLQPTAGTLQSVVQSTGGRPISDTIQLVQIAAQSGAQGGFVPYAGQNGDATMNPANAYGAYGAWKLPLTNFTNPGSGHLVSLLAFTGVSANNSYLYRVQVPGHPELNNMQTDLGLTDQGGTMHNVSGAQQISAQSLQALSAGSLATPSITTANGTVITWDSVPDGGVLSLKGTNGTWVHVESSNGTFRLVNSALSAQMFSVDQSGNVIASGTVTPGVIGSPNNACPKNGVSGLNADGSGQWLQCLNGVLKPFGGNILRYGYYTAQHGTGVPAPTCPAGATKLIVVTPNIFAVDPTTVVNAGASGTGPWTVYIMDGSNTPIAGATATVGTYCGY
ncbi:shufflon system plasmid conjugative transfer pilus tip adhesin PilV [Ralstonia solanacearum]|uniref:shufflon system plasmid conjugative transfer pilus tip adhesin PilV n=1 Tax=Ralstonia solanacearum TaxID=305 RepID=UPI0005C516F1|nr:shufflon system plasmid conjugative transfer pilus tip adhesin PilV [Ralstonia solanacearum]MBB6592753.1 shufflon system plasmid conjugative transfer pilus tip adhesin PilV [Ralstonia solanacearum]MBB6596975.1 shufflon system plasmid conjugative transfer pilus tip adhesin PilV [Ralstonia solanacearum]MDB0541219.1 shufflon system plasmid conjugative transfer pilus tip adhesin PilV [Ralstonia solanacearum]MDB0551407.1 shufflon system plasmid conjugative transfer pilus tip adhesin PilV [Ralston